MSTITWWSPRICGRNAFPNACVRRVRGWSGRGGGEDNVCFETDYPHTDTTWPFAHEEVERMTASLTDAQRYKVLRGNAIRMLDLDRA